jgi:hypothetical protein
MINFCPACADKEKEDFSLLSGDLINKYFLENEFTKEIIDKKTVLAWCQEAKRELEPYLRKLDAVEKKFGGKIKGYGKCKKEFYYLFDKSA